MITVYFDFETGGLTPEHPNISLAAIAVDMRSGIEIDFFYELIQFDPSMADPKALEINRFEPELWKRDAKDEHTVASAFSQFLASHKTIRLTSARTGNPYSVARLAGYNSATFDGPRLEAMFSRYGLFPCWRRPTLDILQLAIDYFDGRNMTMENHKLTTVAKHFGISTEGAHDALADCRMTAKVHVGIIENRKDAR
jgi:DNA polymerase III epsilon subunit-like protein